MARKKGHRSNVDEIHRRMRKEKLQQVKRIRRRQQEMFGKRFPVRKKSER